MSLSEQVKSRGFELGFSLVGIAPAVAPAGVAHLRRWLERGFAGEMSYMQRHASAREHPAHVLEGVRSVIMVAMNYCTVEPVAAGPLDGRVSRYAWGEDYHCVLRERLKRLGDFLHDCVPGCRTRPVVDTAPLLERDFAVMAGLGWIGKNTMLINKRLGSWIFMGALLVDIELEYDVSHSATHCGTCTRCLDACPTDAFAGPYQLDSRRCISYLTIELRGPIPQELRPQIGNWMYGCDVCQDVCPWNSKAPRDGDPAYHPRRGGGLIELTEVAEATDLELSDRIAGTALTRAGVSGMRRNAAIVLGNSGDAGALPSLRVLARSEVGTVSEAANWAIDTIERKPIAESASNLSDAKSDRGGSLDN